MKRVKNRQPAFLADDYCYMEEPLAGATGCFCYELILSKDIILIPNNSLEMLWDISRKEFYCFPYIERSTQLALTGDQLFGIHIDSAYQCSWGEGRAKAWMEQTGRLSSFEERAVFCNEEIARGLYLKERHPLVRHAIEQIEETGGKIVVEGIAEEFGYTPRHLQRLFLKDFSYSPKRFCQYTRLLNAMACMIHSPDTAISSQAETFGYSDPSHFQREFKMYMGMTPKQFLRWYRDE